MSLFNDDASGTARPRTKGVARRPIATPRIELPNCMPSIPAARRLARVEFHDDLYKSPRNPSITSGAVADGWSSGAQQVVSHAFQSKFEAELGRAGVGNVRRYNFGVFVGNHMTRRSSAHWCTSVFLTLLSSCENKVDLELHRSAM